MAVADSFDPVRSSNGLSMTYIEPRFGALALRISDTPLMPTVCATPGTPGKCSRSCLSPSASFSIRAITRCVRSTEAASGSWTLRIR